MKRILMVILVLAPIRLVAQFPVTCPETQNVRVPKNNISRQTSFRSRSSFAPVVAFSRYGIDGAFRSGMMLGLEYVPYRRLNPTFGISGGVVLGNAGPVHEFVVTDAYPTFRNRNPYAIPNQYYAVPRFGFGLGFLGFNTVYYLADGDVRPYVGVGVNAYMWSQYAGTLTPDAKAGLDVRIASGFAGFAEVRHSIGMPNFFTTRYSTFNGLTSFAFGLAFAPRF